MRYGVGGLAVLVAVGVLLSGCGGSSPASEGSAPPSPAAGADTPAERLAGLVAASADHYYTATYDYRSGDGTRRVSVTLATDGSWRVDVPRSGLGGASDVSVAGTSRGVYQCALGDGGSCAKVAKPGGSVPARYDPRVERLFLSWVPKLGDQSAALSVATADNPKGVTGSCFSIEPTAASLSSPVPAGVYCLDQDGAVTGAKTSLGTLARTGKPGPAPKSVTLPGPVTSDGAVPTASPPPSPSGSATPSGSASPHRS